MIHWLARPWFHPVCGNHDDYVCRYELRSGELGPKRRLVSAADPAEQAAFKPSTTAACPGHQRWPPGRDRSGCFTPIAPSPPGRAAGPTRDAGVSGGRFWAIKNVCLWVPRRRIERLDERRGPAALVVGHPVRVPVRLVTSTTSTPAAGPEEGGYAPCWTSMTLAPFPCPGSRTGMG